MTTPRLNTSLRGSTSPPTICSGLMYGPDPTTLPTAVTGSTVQSPIALSSSLPLTFASDPERRARFDREAKTLASLNHPNIAAIYGLEKSGGVTALVMELVEGPTLADRIARGALPLEEALPIATQIAEA